MSKRANRVIPRATTFDRLPLIRSRGGGRRGGWRKNGDKKMERNVGPSGDRGEGNGERWLRFIPEKKGMRIGSRNASNNAPTRGREREREKKKERKKEKREREGGERKYAEKGEEERMSRSTNCQLFLLSLHANAFLSSIPHACVLCVRINLNTNERVR